MNKLPSEILNNIFIWLHQEEKIKCMTVCRYWKRTISSSCLFHTVEMSTINGFRKVIQKLRHEPSRGLQVECLILDFDLFHDFDMDIFLILCPNLKIFYRATVNTDNIQQQTKKVESQSLESHLEHIYELNGGSLALHLLVSKPCSYLKTLVFSGIDNRKDVHFHVLSNTPNLTKLTINRFMLSLDALELLHDTLPHLDSITFLDCEFKTIQLPEHIKPSLCTRAVTFELSNPGAYGKTKLLQYINKKYQSHLVELSYIDFENYQNMHDGEKDIIDSISTEGLVPLLSGLGPQFKKFTIHFDLFDVEHLKALHTTQCQIEHLGLKSVYADKILEALTETPQIRQLQSLHLRNIEVRNFNWLKKLPHLKELKLHNRSRRFCNLENIIKMCNDTMESLVLRCVWIRLSLSSRLFSVKSLILSSAGLMKDEIIEIDDCISKLFPQLKILKLHRCILPKKDFNFSGFHLSCFELIQYDPRKINHILVITQEDNRKQWYFLNHTSHRLKCLHETFDPQDSRVFPPTRSLPYEELIDVPHYAFTFASVKNIIIKS